MIFAILGVLFLYSVIGLIIWTVIGELVENPLILGLMVIFWPATLILTIVCLPIFVFIAWIKECKAYYEDKRNDCR